MGGDINAQAWEGASILGGYITAQAILQGTRALGG